MKYEICSYKNYATRFMGEVNSYMEEHDIFKDQIISITNNGAMTTLWYWGVKNKNK